MKIPEMLFDILRAEISGGVIDSDKYRDYDPEALYKLAKKHSLVYLAADAIYKASLMPQDKQLRDRFANGQLRSAMAVGRIEGVTELIRKLLNEAGIAFIPLKGARLRAMYPDSAMRSSGDIDVLVKQEELDKAVEVLVSHGFTPDEKEYYHNVSLRYKGIHLELHFSICEDMEDIDALLSRVWEYAELSSGSEYSEKPEFFVFHHLAHMKYHFVNGGCGIRTFLDLYIMRRNRFYDEAKLVKLLEQSGLKAFYFAILQVLEVWFEGGSHTELTRQCQSYILSGGVFGTKTSRTAAHSALSRGRIGLAWKTIFLEYPNMCKLYPKLKGRKYLLPFYYAVRVYAKTFRRSERASHQKLRRILAQDKARINTVAELLNAMGLDNRS